MEYLLRRLHSLVFHVAILAFLMAPLTANSLDLHAQSKSTVVNHDDLLGTTISLEGVSATHVEVIKRIGDVQQGLPDLPLADNSVLITDTGLYDLYFRKSSLEIGLKRLYGNNQFMFHLVPA